MEERFRQCAFETEKVFCGISQEGETGERCTMFDDCYSASVKKNEDLTPEEFCRIFPSRTIDEAVLLRQSYLKENPDSKTPLRDRLNKWASKLPSVYGEKIREKISTDKS